MQEWVGKKREAGNTGHPWGVGLGSAIMVPLHSCPLASYGSSCSIGIGSEVTDLPRETW